MKACCLTHVPYRCFGHTVKCVGRNSTIALVESPFGHVTECLTSLHIFQLCCLIITSQYSPSLIKVYATDLPLPVPVPVHRPIMDRHYTSRVYDHGTIRASLIQRSIMAASTGRLATSTFAQRASSTIIDNTHHLFGLVPTFPTPIFLQVSGGYSRAASTQTLTPSHHAPSRHHAQSTASHVTSMSTCHMNTAWCASSRVKCSAAPLEAYVLIVPAGASGILAGAHKARAVLPVRVPNWVHRLSNTRICSQAVTFYSCRSSPDLHQLRVCMCIICICVTQLLRQFNEFTSAFIIACVNTIPYASASSLGGLVLRLTCEEGGWWCVSG